MHRLITFFQPRSGKVSSGFQINVWIVVRLVFYFSSRMERLEIQVVVNLPAPRRATCLPLT